VQQVISITGLVSQKDDSKLTVSRRSARHWSTLHLHWRITLDRLTRGGVDRRQSRRGTILLLVHRTRATNWARGARLRGIAVLRVAGRPVHCNALLGGGRGNRSRTLQLLRYLRARWRGLALAVGGAMDAGGRFAFTKTQGFQT